MDYEERIYDVVVVGGGHAGCEAYAACLRMGGRVAMVTPDATALGLQPCNPAVGGPGKGHLVREIVALGGVMGDVADRSGIQFRTLNRTKGPAVRSTRVQTDAAVYVEEMTRIITQYPGDGTILQDCAVSVETVPGAAGRRVTGLRLARSGMIRSKAVVVTAGTYLRGMLFIGDETRSGGRWGGPPSVHLAESLEALGLPGIRLKTGTCPRLKGDSIDYRRLEVQPGETPAPFFSSHTRDYYLPQRPCHLTYTNDITRQIIETNMTRSAMYSGSISGIGPRYCPSIETKFDRFPDKSRHQIFLEPEDKDGKRVYPSGLSTSLPQEVQLEMVHSIPGLERAVIEKWGYAVEYDAFQPNCMTPALEVDGITGLFLAGQVLGTSGYEEAGAQGLVAGANAILTQRGDTPLIFRRDQAYIGVMIDDLTGRGVDEPYRMFTSRAEYRLLLREDNADERLVEEGARVGLIPPSRIRDIRQLLSEVKTAQARLEHTCLTPKEKTNRTLIEQGLHPIAKPTPLGDLARREGNRLHAVIGVAPWLTELSPAVFARLEVNIRYAGYLTRQAAQARRLSEIDSVTIPSQMTFDDISGLRGEIVEKLKCNRPATLGQASRIPGMTPAAIDILRVFIQRFTYEKTP